MRDCIIAVDAVRVFDFDAIVAIVVVGAEIVPYDKLEDVVLLNVAKSGFLIDVFLHQGEVFYLAIVYVVAGLYRVCRARFVVAVQFCAPNQIAIDTLDGAISPSELVVLSAYVFELRVGGRFRGGSRCAPGTLKR